MNIDKINIISSKADIPWVASEILENFKRFHTLVLVSEDKGSEKSFKGVYLFDNRSTYNSIRKRLSQIYADYPLIAVATPFVDSAIVPDFPYFVGKSTKPIQEYVIWMYN